MRYERFVYTDDDLLGFTFSVPAEDMQRRLAAGKLTEAESLRSSSATNDLKEIEMTTAVTPVGEVFWSGELGESI
jgi:hypothetical protein